MESAASRIRLHVEAKNLDPKPVEALAAAVGKYDDLIERFKTGNSLLQNSLSYVGQLSTDPVFGALGDQFAPSATALAQLAQFGGGFCDFVPRDVSRIKRLAHVRR